VTLAVGEPTGGHPFPTARAWLSAGLVFGGAVAVLTIAAVSFALMAAGITMLTRTAPQDLAPSRPASA